MNPVLLAQVFSCWFMAGVIWIVQILVYPNFQLIGLEDFKRFHQFHINRISWIVAPIMGIELMTAIWLTLVYFSKFYLINLIFVALTWILTAFVNVPSHNKLTPEEKESLARLTLLNWPRTCLWTSRSVFFFWMILNTDL